MLFNTTSLRVAGVYARSQNCEKRLLASSCPSVVRMEQLGSQYTDFHEIWHLRAFRKSVEKIKVSLKSYTNNGYFTWGRINIFFISRSFLLRMRNVSEKPCTVNQNTHFVSSNFFLNSPVYEIMWKYTVQQGRPQKTIWCKRIACWIPKATNTRTQVVQYSLFFHCNNGGTNAPQCYVIRALPNLLLAPGARKLSYCQLPWQIMT